MGERGKDQRQAKENENENGGKRFLKESPPPADIFKEEEEPDLEQSYLGYGSWPPEEHSATATMHRKIMIDGIHGAGVTV